MGLCDEAIRHYKKALTICPDDEHLYFNIARAYLEKKDMGRAQECISHALRINPDFQKAELLLNHLASAHPDGVRDEIP